MPLFAFLSRKKLVCLGSEISPLHHPAAPARSCVMSQINLALSSSLWGCKCVQRLISPRDHRYGENTHFNWYLRAFKLQLPAFSFSEVARPLPPVAAHQYDPDWLNTHCESAEPEASAIRQHGAESPAKLCRHV